MKIYSIVNLDNLKLYETPMIMDPRENVSVPSVDEFALDYLDDLKEYFILEKRTRNLRRGDVEYLRVGMKETHPRKS